MAATATREMLPSEFSELSVEISGIPEALILSLCELIKTISSLQLQDIQLYLQGGDQEAI